MPGILGAPIVTQGPASGLAILGATPLLGLMHDDRQRNKRCGCCGTTVLTAMVGGWHGWGPEITRLCLHGKCAMRVEHAAPCEL